MMLDCGVMRMHVDIVDADINNDGDVTKIKKIRVYDESSNCESMHDNHLFIELIVGAMTRSQRDELEAEFIAQFEQMQSEIQAEEKYDDNTRFL